MAKSKKKYGDYYNSPFAVQLRNLMGYKEETETAKIKQSDVAGEWTTRQTISNYMLGNTLPTSEAIIKIADYFQVSSDYLLGLTDAPTPLKTEEQQALRTACDCTGLSEEIVTLLNEKYEERIATREFSEMVSERLEGKTKVRFPTYPLIDKRLCDIIVLYFDKMKSIIKAYTENAEELTRGINDYKEYVEIKKEEFKKFAAIVIESEGKNEEAVEIFERINEDIADDIIENREMNLYSPLNAANSALFQLQDTLITYAKSLCDITESSQQAYKLINDRSVFLDFDKIYRTVHKDEEGSIIDKVSTFEYLAKIMNEGKNNE